MGDVAVDQQREQGAMATVGTAGKDELDKFNWGAFLWTWIWALGHRAWVWALVGLIPIVGNFVLGFKGNKLAWENGNYASKEELRQKERRWVWAYLIFFVAWIVLWLVVAIAGGAS